MDGLALFDALWRHFPAVVVVLAGLVLLWRGLRSAGRSLVGRGGGVVGFLEGFRLGVVGLALVGLGAAWIWRMPLLLFLALGIGFVETLESSVLIAAMRRDGGRVRAAS
jgi:hypothetical protein